MNKKESIDIIKSRELLEKNKDDLFMLDEKIVDFLINNITRMLKTERIECADRAFNRLKHSGNSQTAITFNAIAREVKKSVLNDYD